MLPANRLTSVFATDLAMIRAYGCERACVPTPKENALGWSSLLLMRGGRFVKETEGVQQLCDTTHAAFFNRGEAYRVWHPDECGDAITEFVLHEDVLRDVVDRLDPSPRDLEERPFARREVRLGTRAFMTHHAIWRAAITGDAPALAIEEAIIAFVHGAVARARDTATDRGARSGPGQPQRRPATRRVRRELAHEARLILTHEHRKPPDLSALAETLGVSPFHFSRVFREETGSSVHGFLVGVRLRRALAQLGADGADLAQIAHQSGFSDQSHMTRHFRRAFGRPPSKLRGTRARELLAEVSKNVQDDSA